jgi:hypothetical protein
MTDDSVTQTVFWQIRHEEYGADLCAVDRDFVVRLGCDRLDRPVNQAQSDWHITLALVSIIYEIARSSPAILTKQYWTAYRH